MQTSNLVYTHPGQPQMQVEVILASASNTGSPPIYTIRMRYPRPIHGEIMTHRVFGRNSRSSRAVPVRTMLNEVKNSPFVPWHWGKNQKGMQASEECNEIVNPMPIMKAAVYDPYELPYEITREQTWLHACNHMVATAEALMNAGYHKQIVNRLLEPFSWIDTLITATQWQNFLWLRDHKDAEPHLQDLARLVKQAIVEAEIQMLEEDQWHLPYITNADRHQLLVDSGRLAGERYQKIVGTNDHFDWLKMISAARCARISYMPFDGNASYERELERYNALVSSDRVHASPLEHQASPDNFNAANGKWDHSQFHGNLTGWIQARKLVPNEVYHG